MKLASYVGAELAQRSGRLQTRGLVPQLCQARFARAESAAILAAYLGEAGESSRLLDADSVARGGIAATEELLYGQPNEWGFELHCLGARQRRGGWSRRLSLRPSSARPAARVLRSMLTDGNSPSLSATLAFLRPEELDSMFDDLAARRSWPEPKGPGIYRREHASVLVQSRAHRLVFDPVCLSPFVPFATTIVPDADVDAVLITHSHDDHWHIPSILATASAHAPVVVPDVPRPTLLCPDMPAQMAAIDQHCLHPPWGAVLKFGDIEVDVLPFFGEQPAVDAQCPDPDVRNWGNCYRVNTPDFSTLLLADSGVDPAGSMFDVVAESVAARGPIDAVLACMRDFRSPFEIGGLNTYWMTLPFAELERLYPMYEAGLLPSTTAGLVGGGLAKICAAAQATLFAGYAQGFAGIGNPVPAGSWGPSPTQSEAQALGELAAQLERGGIATTAQRWNPGDALMPSKSGGPLIHRAIESLD
jgi:L-ascorbate metabolism protein UlaG (beta-lactamase superfamily)